MSQSDFQFKELVRPTIIPTSDQAAIFLPVPIQLTERRIFLYLEVKQSSAASYTLLCEVVALAHGITVGTFPAAIGDIAALTTAQSLPCLYNAGGSPVGDTLVVRLNNPFDTTAAGIQSAALQPLRVNMKIDTLVLSLKAANGANLVGWRAILACLSTQY